MVYEFIHVATSPLRNVAGNQLLLLHERGATDEEVIAYGVRYKLMPEEEEKKYIRFKNDPLWRSYGFNYSLGHDLISGLLSSYADKVQAFALVLREPMMPAQVERMVSQ